jgi:hypothetical protein
VKTVKGELGWIDERAVVTQPVFDAFHTLAAAHKGDPAVASAVVPDEVNLHLMPGRETEHFYRLGDNAKLQMLERATLPKPTSGAPAAAAAAGVGKGAKGVAVGPPPVAMEDWWLVRDGQGRVGWLLSRALEVDAPADLTQYAEGQRFVGAYVLTTVNDPGAKQEDKNIPIYLTVLSPYKAGLPYDFDQVRVFTWSTKMHRYETAFREKNIEGYLPVGLKQATDLNGRSTAAATPLPTFTYKVLAADAGPVIPDPGTGLMTPGRLIAKTYRLEGNAVRRVQPAGSHDEAEAHPMRAEAKKVEGKKAGKKR